MSFELPDLDTVSYEQIVADLIRRIPQYTDQWTDYNESDPGITLLQLLAWLDESLLYQANRIPLATELNFLRWVLGLAFSANQTDYSAAAAKDYDFDFLALQSVLAGLEQGAQASKASLQRDVLLYLQQPYLALTADNVEQLALQTNRMIAAQAAQRQSGHASATAAVPLYVQRACAQAAEQATCIRILSDAPWQYRYPPYPNQDSAAHRARRVLMLQPQPNAAAEDTLLRQVGIYLAPRVIAGTAVRVQPAQLTAIDLTIAVRCGPNMPMTATLDALVAQLYGYLLPSAGPDASGWRYGQAPNPEDLMHMVLAVSGVESIESFIYTYFPTVVLDEMAQLGVNTLLAALPDGRTALQYRGLPQLRCLDITACNAPP